MKRNKITNIIIALCIVAVAIKFTFYLYDALKTSSYQEWKQKECAYIGGITIGTDSIKAVDQIRKRLIHIGGKPDIIIFGDSIGYYSPEYNEKYYVTLDKRDHTVNQIYFHSDSLTNQEVDVIARGNRFSKYKQLYHKGKTWTSYQDGQGTFMIYKNKIN